MDKINSIIYINIRLVSLWVILCAHPLQIYSQDQKILAQSEYYIAEEAYNEGDYDKALVHLGKSEEYAGINHLVQHLRVKAYYNDAQYVNSKDAIDVFFKITPEKYNNTDQYKEVVVLVSEVNSLIEDANGLYKKAISSKNLISYQDYLEKYPNANAEYSSYMVEIVHKDEEQYNKILNTKEEPKKIKLLKSYLSNIPRGIFYKEANTMLDKLLTLSSFYDKWKVFQSGGLQWMAYLHLSDEHISKGHSLGVSYTKYSLSEAKKVCANGWRLPTNHDFAVLVKRTNLHLGKRQEKKQVVSELKNKNWNGFGIEFWTSDQVEIKGKIFGGYAVIYDCCGIYNLLQKATSKIGVRCVRDVN